MTFGITQPSTMESAFPLIGTKKVGKLFEYLVRT